MYNTHTRHTCVKTLQILYIAIIHFSYESMLTSALLCLNNIAAQVNVEQFGGTATLRTTLNYLYSSLSLSQGTIQHSTHNSVFRSNVEVA